MSDNTDNTRNTDNSNSGYTKIPEFVAMRGFCIDCGGRVIMAGVWADGAEDWQHERDVHHPVLRVRAVNTCPKCGAEFEYEPKYHRCPGEWEAMVGKLPEDPYAGMTWAEECLAKVRGKR